MPAKRGGPGITEDTVLGGRLRLLQPRRGHRAGHDAILLAASVSPQASGHLVDLGAGVGTAGLAAAVRNARLKVTLVEIDPSLTALAKQNILLNALSRCARAICLDATTTARSFTAAGLPPESADHVIMNPPFNVMSRQQMSPVAARRKAHSTLAGTLVAWTKTALRLLRPSGTLTLIWRADGLAEVLAALPISFGAIAVLPIHARADQPAIRVIVRALKGRRTPLTLLPGFSLNDRQGRPLEAAEAILRRGEALPLVER
ncbi:MAG: methyltransferase [Rhizobiales bacterium]|nr:methyltransferase [Hyphomicrobiales bacterium]